MSEYQYHEWQNFDRLFTADEQAKVNRLSSYIEVSPSRAVVTYNWGSRRWIFRFPKGILNQEEIKQYCDSEFVSFDTFGQYQVMDINFNPEDGGSWIEQNDNLSSFTSLRDDLLQGDYLMLYYQDTQRNFFSQIHILAKKYTSRPSLMDRWKKRGWL
jgi:hypothetical protein